MIILYPLRSRSLMDRILVCGTGDPSSILGESTEERSEAVLEQQCTALRLESKRRSISHGAKRVRYESPSRKVSSF